MYLYVLIKCILKCFALINGTRITQGFKIKTDKAENLTICATFLNINMQENEY